MRFQESIIGHSPALATALEQVSRLASINRPVLVMGERGTGKELAAQRLHYLSPRWKAPLLKINCAALADTLLESELFGHEAGAFTGATHTRKGRFERAEGGTLFLDEIATMSTRLQEKLLRVIEYGEFERVGGRESLQVDVRVVGASNVDLRALVAENRFRADLLDRLSFDVVHLPPLRHRIGDIEELARHFAVQMCTELGWDLFPGFTESAVRSLEQYYWPGNVRELKNTVERSLFRWGNAELPVDDIVLDPFESPYTEDEGVMELRVPGNKTASTEPVDFHGKLRQLEVRLLHSALKENGFNQRRTAAALGLTYDQLRGMVRKYGMSVRGS